MFLGRALSNREIALISSRWTDALRRASVQDVVMTHSGMAHDGKSATNEVMTRLAKIKAAVTPDDFAKLYTKEALKEAGKSGGDQGGLELDRVEKRKAESAAFKHEQSEIEFKENARKWAERPAPPIELDAPDLRFDETYVNPVPQIATADGKTMDDPDYHLCSFGHEPHVVHRERATFGKGANREMAIYEPHMINGVKVIKRRWIKWRDKLTACPDHCLWITDTTFATPRE